jgi:hypothetical protein
MLQALMTVQPQTSSDNDALVTTVDVRELHSIRWGIMRQLFPKFVEEVELGHDLRVLLTSGHYGAVRVQPHCGPDGRPSPTRSTCFV